MRAVSEDGKRVRRAVPLAPGAEEDIIKAVEARSLYASPFPMDSTLDGVHALRRRAGSRRADALRRAGLTAFFSQHGDVRSIRMRKHLASQDFKGSVFLEMGSVEEAQALMDKTLVHEGATLVRAGRLARRMQRG